MASNLADTQWLPAQLLLQFIFKVTKAITLGDLDETFEVDVWAQGEMLDWKLTVNSLVAQTRLQTRSRKYRWKSGPNVFWVARPLCLVCRDVEGTLFAYLLMQEFELTQTIRFLFYSSRSLPTMSTWWTRPFHRASHESRRRCRLDSVDVRRDFRTYGNCNEGGGRLWVCSRLKSQLEELRGGLELKGSW